MPFRLYTNWLSQASRNAAAAIFVTGLLLIGFGVIIVALPELFAMLAALVFFIVGIGCAATAVRIFIAHRRLEKLNREDRDTGRVNVRIREF
jgi:membrane protein implicated in regulation of membrane protease activity